MSEQEKQELRDKINRGLRQGYYNLLRTKASLGLEMVTADENGNPITAPAAELLAKQNEYATKKEMKQ